MKWLGIWLVVAGTSVVGLAQTNALAIRQMSLEDCIQSALEKNLDLRIARFNPPMALADLQSAYAGYDPNFSIPRPAPLSFKTPPTTTLSTLLCRTA
jgi:hypothetical protein